VYVRQTHNWWFPPRFTSSSSYQVGDIVIFQKQASDNYYSCKRIIGMEGQQVLVYGQYVHLFQDRTDKGIVVTMDPQMNMNMTQQQQQEEDEGQQPPLPFAFQTSSHHHTHGAEEDATTNECIKCRITIPPGHVWVEGDNPLDSLDSRHYGPIPLSALRGRLVMRLWPLWRTTKPQSQSQSTTFFDPKQDTLWMSRTRPIPLSRQHLLNGNYNLHPRPTPA